MPLIAWQLDYLGILLILAEANGTLGRSIVILWTELHSHHVSHHLAWSADPSRIRSVSTTKAPNDTGREADQQTANGYALAQRYVTKYNLG